MNIEVNRKSINVKLGVDDLLELGPLRRVIEVMHRAKLKGIHGSIKHEGWIEITLVKNNKKIFIRVEQNKPPSVIIETYQKNKKSGSLTIIPSRTAWYILASLFEKIRKLRKTKDKIIKIKKAKIQIKYNGKIYKGIEGAQELLKKIYREAIEIPEGWEIAIIITNVDGNTIEIDTEIISSTTDIVYSSDVRSPSIIAWIISPQEDIYEDVEYDEKTKTWKTWTGEKITEEEIIENYLYWITQKITDDFVRAIVYKAREIREWLRIF